MQLPDCEDPDVDIIDRVDEELLLTDFAGHEHEQQDTQNCFVTAEQEVANNNHEAVDASTFKCVLSVCEEEKYWLGNDVCFNYRCESTAQTCYNQQYFHQLPAHYLQTLVTGLIWNQQQVERGGGAGRIEIINLEMNPLSVSQASY